MREELIKIDLEGKATGVMKEANPKYDWATMKADYLSSRTMTLKQIATKYGCSELSVKIHSAKENWVNEKAEINKQFVQAATAANLKKQAKTAIQFNESCLAESINLLESIKEEHANLKATGELNANHLGKLAASLKTCQESGRLALGLSNKPGETGAAGSATEERTIDTVSAELIALIGEEKYNAIYGEATDGSK